MDSQKKSEMITKIEALAKLLESDTVEKYLRLGYTLSNHNFKASVKVGRKYANVDIGGSGRYMVELETGDIFGIKAYGVIHRGYRFGNINTVHEFYWGDYRAVRKPKEEINGK